MNNSGLHYSLKSLLRAILNQIYDVLSFPFVGLGHIGSLCNRKVQEMIQLLLHALFLDHYILFVGLGLLNDL